MSNMIHGTGKARSIPAGMAIAASMSMFTTILFSAVIANFLNTETITWKQAGYWIMGMLFSASFISGRCAFATIKRQRITVSLMAGILYWGLLLSITALFFGGTFGAVWETAGIIGAGCGSAALLSGPNTKKSRKKTRRVYR